MTYDESPVERTMSLAAHLPPDEAGLTRLGAQEQIAVDALADDHALLIVQHGPNAGARFLLDVDQTLAGRSVACDIFLDDITVSREHAHFLRSGSEFRVRDAGSLNGTYVNRDRVAEAVLQAGDEVQIGKYRLTFYPSATR